MRDYHWKSLMFGVLLGLGLVFFLPNVVAWRWLPQTALRFGLDIQGGLHLVLGFDESDVRSQFLQTQKALWEGRLKEEKIEAQVTLQGEALRLEFSSPESWQAIESILKEAQSQWAVSKENDRVVLLQPLTVVWEEEYKRVLNQSLETIRNRIDEFGLAEPSVMAQSDTRIVVQLPGVQDPESAKALVSSAAKLEFLLVDDSVDGATLAGWLQKAKDDGIDPEVIGRYSEYVKKLNEYLQQKQMLPSGRVVYFEKHGSPNRWWERATPLVLQTEPSLDGTLLEDARVQYDQFGRPEVGIVWKPQGALLFQKITGENIQRRMAIVLDRVIKSAPVIQTEIAGGRAVITLGRSESRQEALNEAKMIASSLRAGSLPVSLEILEERQVGPTLGAAYLKQAQWAAGVGLLLVVTIMIIRYRVMGLIASVALILNILLILAILGAFKAVLTLPGIGGLALTMGVAVDANILIFERIREELAKGFAFKKAFYEGYHQAFRAIFDSNVAVAGTSLVLLSFGVGPIRGFAITLLTGIITTLLMQVGFTKVVGQWLVEGFKLQKILV